MEKQKNDMGGQYCGGGKNPSTFGLRIFAHHRKPRGELMAQYRPPMPFRSIIAYTDTIESGLNEAIS